MSLPGRRLPLLLLCAALSVANALVIYQPGAGGPSGRRQAGSARDNVIFSEGFVGPDDELYFSLTDSDEGEIDDYVSQNITFIHIPGNFTFVQVTEVGDSQNATASMVEGGLDCWYLTINIQSDVSAGYYVDIEIYGTPYFRESSDFRTLSTEEFFRKKRDEECEDIEWPPTDPPTTTVVTDASI